MNAILANMSSFQRNVELACLRMRTGYDMRRFLVISALIVLEACNATDDARPERESDDGQFEATVIGVEDCNMVLLEFKEEDVPAIQEISDIESSRFFAVNLTKVLLQPGQKLSVVIRKLRDDELFACPTFAPTYPGLYLISFQFI
jgi:hypothetical protein